MTSYALDGLTTAAPFTPLMADQATRHAYLTAEINRVIRDYSRPTHGVTPGQVRADIAHITAEWADEGGRS